MLHTLLLLSLSQAFRQGFFFPPKLDELLNDHFLPALIIPYASKAPVQIHFYALVEVSAAQLLHYLKERFFTAHPLLDLLHDCLERLLQQLNISVLVHLAVERLNYSVCLLECLEHDPFVDLTFLCAHSVRFNVLATQVARLSLHLTHRNPRACLCQQL